MNSSELCISPRHRLASLQASWCGFPEVVISSTIASRRRTLIRLGTEDHAKLVLRHTWFRGYLWVRRDKDNGASYFVYDHSLGTDNCGEIHIAGVCLFDWVHADLQTLFSSRNIRRRAGLGRTCSSLSVSAFIPRSITFQILWKTSSSWVIVWRESAELTRTGRRTEKEEK